MGLNKSLNKAEYDRLRGSGFTHLEALQTLLEDILEDLVEELGQSESEQWDTVRMGLGYYLLTHIQDSQGGDYMKAFEQEDPTGEEAEKVFKTVLKKIK